MKPRRGLTGPFTLELAKLIGRSDFPNAIRYLQTYLGMHPQELHGWTFLAQCQRWAGSDAEAIESATQALQLNPTDFAALRMLSEIYATRNDEEKAVTFIRRGLENFPEPLPPVPPALIKAFRFVAPVLPKRLAAAVELDIPGFEDRGAGDRKWFNWAKEYLAWYEGETGNSAVPIVH